MADTFIVTADGKDHFVEPEKARFNDVQIIVQEVPDGYGSTRKEVLLNYEYYYYFAGRWRGTHSDAVALQHYFCGCPLLGSFLMDDEDWAKLRDRHL